MKPITYGLEPYRPIPGQLVQTLPTRKPNTTILGHVLAIVVGATLAVLALAAEGAFS